MVSEAEAASEKATPKVTLAFGASEPVAESETEVLTAKFADGESAAVLVSETAEKTENLAAVVSVVVADSVILGAKVAAAATTIKAAALSDKDAE